jgi:hypothetical protein
MTPDAGVGVTGIVEGIMAVEQVAGHLREFYTEGNVGYIAFKVVMFENNGSITCKIGSGDANFVKLHGVTLSRHEAMKYFPEYVNAHSPYEGESAIEIKRNEQST